MTIDLDKQAGTQDVGFALSDERIRSMINVVQFLEKQKHEVKETIKEREEKESVKSKAKI